MSALILTFSAKSLSTVPSSDFILSSLSFYFVSRMFIFIFMRLKSWMNWPSPLSWGNSYTYIVEAGVRLVWVWGWVAGFWFIIALLGLLGILFIGVGLVLLDLWVEVLFLLVVLPTDLELCRLWLLYLSLFYCIDLFTFVCNAMGGYFRTRSVEWPDWLLLLEDWGYDDPGCFAKIFGGS